MKSKRGPRWWWGLAALVFIGATQASSGSLAFMDSKVQMDADARDGQYVLVLRAAGLSLEEGTREGLVAQVKDTGFPAAPSVEVADVHELETSGRDARLWVIMLSVTGANAGLAQTRYLTLTFAGEERTLSYILTNASAQPLTLAVSTGAPIKVRPGDPVPIWVTALGRAASQVRLTQYGVREKSTGWALDDDLKLCTSAAANCEGRQGVGIAPNQTQQLWLWAPEAAGKYEGEITVAATEKPEGATTKVVIAVSSGLHAALGVFCILLGVLAAWLFFHLFRERAEQLRWSLAGAELRARAVILESRAVSVAPVSLPKLAITLQQVASALDDAALQAAGLPSVDWAPGLIPRIGKTDELRAHLKAQIDVLDVANLALDLVERSALPELARSDDTRRQRLLQALTRFDDLFGPATPTLVAVGEAFAAAMRVADDAAGNKLESLRELTAAAEAPKRVARLRSKIAWLGVGAWAFTALLTTATGAYLLVFEDPYAGFGTGLDFLKCFLWGVGIPAATQLFKTDRTAVASWTTAAAKG